MLSVLSVYFTGWRRPRPFTTLDSEFFWAGELEHSGRFPFNPNFWKFRLVHQMERTISVWSGRNIRDQLWRWSTLTGLGFSVGRTEMSLFIWQNCCPQYRSFVSCLQENNNNRRGGLGRVYATGMYHYIGHVKFPKFQTEIFVEWKAPPVANEKFPISEIRGIGSSFGRNDFWDILGGQGLLMIG